MFSLQLRLKCFDRFLSMSAVIKPASNHRLGAPPKRPEFVAPVTGEVGAGVMTGGVPGGGGSTISFGIE